jgi:Xaa-Pro dipeptidase
MVERGLDLFIAFHPTSVTYLTGFFTTAWTLFSLAVIPREGDPLVVCRDNEEYWLDRTGAFGARLLWEDGETADLPDLIRRAIARWGGTRARIGVESSAPYDAGIGERLGELLPNAVLVDMGSEFVARMREIKSPAEIDLMRQASRAVEAATEAGRLAVRPGVTERQVAAAISSALIVNGSDVAGPGPMGSGPRSAHLHAAYEDRQIRLRDSVVFEVDGCVHYYYARFFRTLKVGTASRSERDLARRLIDLQDRGWSEIRPGASVAAADRVIRDGLEKLAGGRYTNNTFSSIGLTMAPAPALLAVRGSEWTFEAGMAFHSYVMAKGVLISETVLVTDTGYERLTTYPREMLVTPG